jgi:hypothetical protein
VTVMVRMEHLRAAGMCNREPRIFCRRQGWSWQEFIDTGLPAELLEATGDPMALRVAAIARAAHHGE